MVCNAVCVVSFYHNLVCKEKDFKFDFKFLLVKWTLGWSFFPQRGLSTAQKESFSPTSSVFSVQSSERHINIYLNNSHKAQHDFTALQSPWTVPFFVQSLKLPSSICETYPELLSSGSCVLQNIWLTLNYKVHTAMLIFSVFSVWLWHMTPIALAPT